MDDVPNLSDIVKGKAVDVIDKVGLCFATCVALIDVIKGAEESDVKDYFSNALAYIKQFATPEFSLFFVRQCVKRRSELVDTSVYAKFKVEHQDLEY